MARVYAAVAHDGYPGPRDFWPGGGRAGAGPGAAGPAARVILVDDPREGKGPVQGIAAGLSEVAGVAGSVEAAFVCATDMPFLHPAFVRRVLRAVGGGADVALPVARGYPQPLAAAYRTSLADVAERLVVTGRLRPSFLFAECAVVRFDEEVLREDPPSPCHTAGSPGPL